MFKLVGRTTFFMSFAVGYSRDPTLQLKFTVRTSLLITAIVLGLLLLILSLDGKFTFVRCTNNPPGNANFCINVTSLDWLAILAGSLAMSIGVISLIRNLLHSPKSDGVPSIAAPSSHLDSNGISIDPFATE